MSEVKKSGHSHHQRGRFSGKIGYVLAVAGSAVGLGNIWRFPYIVSDWGGMTFLLPYLMFVVLIASTWRRSTAEECSCWFISC